MILKRPKTTKMFKSESDGQTPEKSNFEMSFFSMVEKVDFWRPKVDFFIIAIFEFRHFWKKEGGLVEKQTAFSYAALYE